MAYTWPLMQVKMRYSLYFFPVDCVLGRWGAWDTCSKRCDGGMQTSTRTIVQQAKNGGTLCLGELTRKQNCNELMCASKEGDGEIYVIVT